MTGGLHLPAGYRRRAATLAAIILLQAVCAAFFIGDVVSDIGTAAGEAARVHHWIEGLVSATLVVGIALQMIELRHLFQRVARSEQGIRAARGEMAGLIQQFFDEWGLTPAERDVALLILKGIDNETIAGLRGTAVGTVRAQSAAVYAKAGVDGRAQLFSLFMEELLSDPEHR